MDLQFIDLLNNIIQVVMIVIMTIWFGVRNRESRILSSKLFFWGLMSEIMMSIYWVCTILVYGDGDYATFNASDTSTLAMLLFWTSMFYLRNKVDYSNKAARALLPVSMLLIGIWNIVWWTLWTGNIVINILWGVAFSLLAYMVFYSLERPKAIGKKVKTLWILMATVLFIFEIPMYIYENDSIIYIASDWICAAAWLVLSVLFVVMAYKDRPHKTVWLFASMIFTMYAQYLTDGIRYTFFMLMTTIVTFILIFNFKIEDIGEEDMA